MAIQTWYLLDTKASGINHLDAQASAPTAADSTTGWAAGTVVNTQNQYSPLAALVSQVRGTWSGTASPTTIDTTNGNGWRLTSAPLTGSFAAGSWTFAEALKQAAGDNSSDLCISFALWKSSNADGSGGSIVGARQVTADQSNLTGTTNISTAYDPSAGAGFSLSAEYLFLLNSLKTLSPALSGFTATSQFVFRLGTNLKVVSTDFTSSTGAKHRVVNSGIVSSLVNGGLVG